jgi:DNA-binding NtrC family response regulator
VSGPRFDDGTKTLVRESIVQRPLGAIVRVYGAEATPTEYQLQRGKCVLGSAKDCQIAIAEATVSRRHAALSLVPEGVLVADLGSHNGTYYMGQRVEKMVLAFGGRIQLGSATVAVDLDVASLSSADGIYPNDRYRGLVGPSDAMRRLFSTLARLEGSLVTVLVEGESGVGKELVAAGLHQGSAVCDGPFVVVNCGAIPRDLVASELFGHKKGAFTGAAESRDGAFVSAHGGTLFLDEIGELPIDVQPILLRALESGEVRPVGDDRVRRVKTRVVAATNRALHDEVQAGRFRQDLFYRLAVVCVRVPPLRERPEDIAELAQHFADAHDLGPLPPDVLANLSARPWDGNVRELRNAIEAYKALGTLPQGSAMPVAQLDAALRQHVDLSLPYADQKDLLIEQFTRLYLEALLHHTGGNQTTAAGLAGLGRSYLSRLISKHGISGKR